MGGAWRLASGVGAASWHQPCWRRGALRPWVCGAQGEGSVQKEDGPGCSRGSDPVAQEALLM